MALTELKKPVSSFLSLDPKDPGERAAAFLFTRGGIFGTTSGPRRPIVQRRMARHLEATGSGRPRPPRTGRPAAPSSPPAAHALCEVDAELADADRAFLDSVAKAAVTPYL